MSWWGASPSHALQCLTVGKRLIAVPISARMVWASEAEIPVTAISATPVRRSRGARTVYAA